jgi:hypothetical protein
MAIENSDATIEEWFLKRIQDYTHKLAFKIKKKEFMRVQ